MKLEKYIKSGDLEALAEEARKQPDVLATFILGNRLKKMAETILGEVKDTAVVVAEAMLGESGGEYEGVKISFRREKIYSFDNARLNRILESLTAKEKEVKALKDSRKATEQSLIADGEAELLEIKTIIVVK
jgi:hypothetical protein